MLHTIFESEDNYYSLSSLIIFRNGYRGSHWTDTFSYRIAGSRYRSAKQAKDSYRV